MATAMEQFIKQYLKQNLPDIKPGDVVRVHQKVQAAAVKDKKGKEKEAAKERIQVFEGLVIARKHGKEPGAMITVRRVLDGVGIERQFPLHCPTIEKIEILARAKVRRAKLYYLREARGKRARLKHKEFVVAQSPPKTNETTESEKPSGPNNE